MGAIVIVVMLLMLIGAGILIAQYASGQRPGGVE